MTAPTDPQPAPALDHATDPFDPAALRLSGTADRVIGTRPVLVTAPVRKPDKSWFVRVHPDPDYGLETMLIDLKADREMYLVDRSLWSALACEPLLKPYRLVAALSRQGVNFLWPLRLPGPDGKLDTWSESALQAAEEAKANWVRVVANMSLGGYDVTAATGVLPEPVFPTGGFHELLKIAFRGKLIDSADHPVLRKLRGEL